MVEDVSKVELEVIDVVFCDLVVEIVQDELYDDRMIIVESIFIVVVVCKLYIVI